MDIYFASKGIQKDCSSDKQMRKRWGDRTAQKLRQRLVLLEAVANLSEMVLLPGSRCHELSGNRKGQLAVDLVHPHRLVFQPATDPVPLKADGGLDWSKVTSVLVLEVVDYH